MKQKTIKLTIGLVVLALSLGLAGTAMAGNTATQGVTIDVQLIDELSASGAPGTLTINATTAGVSAGASSFTVTNAATTYSVTTNATSTRKITAHLDSAMSTAGLSLFITGASASGVSAGEVNITSAIAAAPLNVVTGLAQEADSAQTITYKATAGLTTPIGSVTRTVTLTLSAG